MRLRTKFSLLLSGCVVLVVSVNGIVQARFFAQDQEAYLNDFQASVALFIERQLESRMALLYTQLNGLARGTRGELAEVVSEAPGMLGAEVWAGERRVEAHPESPVFRPPPASRNRWSLTASPIQEPPAIRWIGRYEDRVLVIDLSADWFAEILESSHGLTSRLLLENGETLLSSQAGNASNAPFDVLLPPGFLATLIADKRGFVETRAFQSRDGSRQLTTILPLPSDPPLFVALTTPWSTIERVVQRTFRQSAWILLLFLVLSVAAAFVFSGTLTSPLRALVGQTVEIAKGNFESIPPPTAQRRDEVGQLTHSFVQMSHELVKIRGELRRSERLAALGQFSASIAHEIKNPLAGILGNTQVARRVNKEPGANEATTMDQLLGFVEEETKRANRIVNRLMTFARHDHPPSAVIDLNDRVKRTVEILSALAVNQGVTLESTLCAEVLEVVADGDELHEMLLNLVQNALHAVRNAATKRVSVSLSRVGALATLVVEDTGHGIGSDVKEHLFEPFFTTKPIGEGTGLGLAVCHGIVVNHRGSIDVQSEEGKGTRFVIQFPVAPSRNARAAA